MKGFSAALLVLVAVFGQSSAFAPVGKSSVRGETKVEMAKSDYQIAKEQVRYMPDTVRVQCVMEYREWCNYYGRFYDENAAFHQPRFPYFARNYMKARYDLRQMFVRSPILGPLADLSPEEYEAAMAAVAAGEAPPARGSTPPMVKPSAGAPVPQQAVPDMQVAAKQ